MKVVIDVATWGEAHHLACALADVEQKFRTSANTEPTFGIGPALKAYADFFRRTAREITRQAEPLNWAAWHKRRDMGGSNDRPAGRPIPTARRGKT